MTKIQGASSERFKNYIGGKWEGPREGKTFLDVNPADHEDLIGTFPESGKDEVDCAVQAAQKAFDEWRKTPAPIRGEIIFRAAETLKKRKEELAKLMTREMGKVIKEARGDVQEAIDMALHAAGEGRRLFGQTTPSELRNKFAMSIRMPIGACGLITPWNFPMAIPSWKIFPALITGNTVVFKPAEDTPLCGARLVEILEEAGLPSGVLNLVHGGPSTGQLMVRHPGLRLISFTGSCEVGREVAEEAAKAHKRCSLEMGGKNAQIVMDDANLDLAVEGALWGAFGTTGQRCTATSRLIVHEKVFDTFLKRFAERVKHIKIGDGSKDASVEIGPLINEVQKKKVHAYVEIGQKEGAKLECGGHPPQGSQFDRGNFYLPTVFTSVHPKMKIMQEEIFGPVTCVMKVRSLEEAIQVLNDTPYGLSSSIYTENVNRAFFAIRDIECGITYINGPTIGAEVHLPFGGIKNTGNGHREGGETVYDIFTEWKTVFIDYSGKLQKAQMDVD